MADFRLSAQIIKRSNGRSSVAASAYRAGERLIDLRTGENHNYTKKSGVVHAEILAPENSPTWMLSRSDLWNAVEKVERRKDAQLAREVQLSLPHELEPEQRLELVRGFAQEQFIERGMIADVCIHTPDKGSDERNHHAHIMLTMRDLTADGFGKKNRDWNDREIVTQWREQWANHQNRMLERHGHADRVNHRSYEAQGIDLEPTNHRGQIASNMEANGKVSRIGQENRDIEKRNADRANNMAQMAVVEARKSAVTALHDRKEVIDRLELNDTQKQEREQLEQQIRQDQEQARAVINSQLSTVQHRLENASGIKKMFRDLIGKTRADTETQNELKNAINTLDHASVIRRQQLEIAHREQRQDLAQEALKDRFNEQPKEVSRSWKRASTQGNDNKNSWRRPSDNSDRGRDI